ncbi:PhoU domain-containing protein [Kitasatospora azatica]|uniref:PhoU domain-containing protein n=1 Tax=Kitasatospora azatica TaxID=58347 RepID=UPI0018DBA640|nr:PhoU domain-containing protein [Kitasatospora azatica]
MATLEGAAMAAEKALSELRERIEEDAAGVLRGGSPKVSDRHAIVVGVHVGSEVECLADLVEQLLRLAWSRQSTAPWPDRLRVPLHGMGAVALAMLAKAADLLESEDAEAGADLLTTSHEVGQRQRLLYELLLSGAEPVAAGDIADATLLACHYQRCAGHAVSIARHAALFTATA